MFSSVGTNSSNANAAALLAIFNSGGVPLGLDQVGQDLQGLRQILLGLDNLKVNMPGNLATGTAPTVAASSLSSNFNNVAIPAGDTIWFNATVQVSGFNNAPGVQLYFSGSTITFTAPGSSTPVVITVPSAVITFSPYTSTAASTTYDAATNTWQTIVPENYNGQVFLTGVAYHVPSTLPGSIKNVTWSGTFSSNTTGLQATWQTGAAVYTNFGSDPNSFGVQPVSANGNPWWFCWWPPSTPAGTPTGDTSWLVAGAQGNGRGDYIGSAGPSVRLCIDDYLVQP